MPREKLPSRRKSWTQKVKIENQTFYCTFGEYPDGRLGEVFIEAHKEGSFLRGVLGSNARMVSVALQHGCPVHEVVKTLRHLNFPPNGEVVDQDGYSEVRVCSSVMDWIAQEIENTYCRSPGAWVEKMAKEDDGGCISVGGMVTRMEQEDGPTEFEKIHNATTLPKTAWLSGEYPGMPKFEEGPAQEAPESRVPYYPDLSKYEPEVAETIKSLWPQKPDMFDDETLKRHEESLLKLRGEIGRHTKGTGV